jgi:predicted RNA binding protein YcfA (HicA-like mRNA interferase family)
MPKNISWKNLVKKFRKLGFDGPYSGGRHLFMVKSDLKVRIPNPHEGDISRHLLSEILRQANVSPRDWNKARNTTN